MLEQITADGPVTELADQGQHAIGLNRSPPLDNPVQQGEDIAACDLESFPLSPVGVRPVTRWVRVVSMASARVSVGRMVVRQRTSGMTHVQGLSGDLAEALG